MMVMAHLKTQATSANMEERQQWKRVLFRLLLSKGYSREQVVNLFRFVDRMMKLPKELEEQLTTEIIEGREERQMPFMSQFEEIAQEKATLRNQRQNTLEILEVRFGEVPPEVVEAVNGIEDLPTLTQLFREAIAIGSVAQFQELLNSVIEG
jgi:16S rRNA C967 or C1407 C5-methylase (RsmB/RsmF family)